MMEVLREEMNTILSSLALVAVLVYAVMRDRKTPLNRRKTRATPWAR